MGGDSIVEGVQLGEVAGEGLDGGTDERLSGGTIGRLNSRKEF